MIKLGHHEKRINGGGANYTKTAYKAGGSQTTEASSNLTSSLVSLQQEG